MIADLGWGGVGRGRWSLMLWIAHAESVFTVKVRNSVYVYRSDDQCMVFKKYKHYILSIMMTVW